MGGEEDCLYLNVYAPLGGAGNSSWAEETYPQLQDRAVMVWIHGGGFMVGDGNPWFHGPELFMDHDVILVTLNYRVGPFGFFTLENDSAPGNLGLRDQVMALKWVKRNIKYFGGNPARVTIFGESAGSMSVTYLLVSPAASVSIAVTLVNNVEK